MIQSIVGLVTILAVAGTAIWTVAGLKNEVGNGEFVFEEYLSEMSYFIEIYDQSECVYSSEALIFDCECKSDGPIDVHVIYYPCERYRNTVSFGLFSTFGPGPVSVIKEVKNGKMDLQIG